MTSKILLGVGLASVSLRSGLKMLLVMAAGVLVTYHSAANATRVEARVSTYHRMSSIAGETFAIVPTEEQRNSLEWDSVAAKLSEEMSNAGAMPAPPESAKLLVSFVYFMGAQGVKTINLPMIGQTGVSSATTTGTIRTNAYGSSYSGRTTYTPSIGVTGFVPMQVAQNERILRVVIMDGQEYANGGTKPLYEGKVSSIGRCDSVAVVVPYMIEALFQSFPGESGQGKLVKLKVDKAAKEGNP